MRLSPRLVALLSALASACSPQERAAPLENLLGFALEALAPQGIPGPGIDPHQGGTGRELRLAALSWGRLADVYAVEVQSKEKVLIARELVIGPDIATDGHGIELDTDAITRITEVTILAEIGSSAFDSAWKRLEAGLVPIVDKSVDPAELPPFTKVPRDAAVVARFDDLLDPRSVDAETLQIWTGEGTVERFPARVLIDRNHGGWTAKEASGGPRFFPTRVILDMTTSEAEALETPGIAQVHPRGLPASRTTSLPNVVLRIPTSGERIVRNLAGRGPATSGNGSIDTVSFSCRGTRVPTDDLVRAFLSGSDGDASHGLLADTSAPRILGLQPARIDAVAADPQGGPQDYLAILTFQTQFCARPARVRDVVVTPTAMAVVTRASAPPSGAEIGRVRLRVVAGGTLASGLAEYRAPYDPALDGQGHGVCFVRFHPEPGFPPSQGVDPASQLEIAFSEPMDPRSITGLETWTVSKVASPSEPSDFTSASVQPNVILDRYVLTPVLPLQHVAGLSETWFMNLAPGSAGPTDLAGNPLRDSLPTLPFVLDPAAPSTDTGSYVLRFQSDDEDGNGHPELRGQFLRDLAQGSIRPRAVSRFSAVADRTQPVPSVMTPVPSGVQTPLVPLGSKLHALWRYCDVGMALLDESLTNLDVEGLAWSPLGGSVVADQYAAFEMSLSHSRRLPDELLDSTTLLPQYPDSGLVARYDRNQLDPLADPLTVVHPRARGYTVNPADAFTSTTGTPMMPWPMNRNLPPSQHAFYTWRNTALQAQGGAEGTGAELGIVVAVQGTGTPGVPYPAGAVPSVALPLLMEFKCFPDQNAVGLNLLDASLAINASSTPNFRAFSAGGTDSSGVPIAIDPDQETAATGGFNPASNPPGQRTLGVENVFYLGQMDLVVRVSRLHSVWIDTGSAGASYAPPVLEPAASGQPAGTQVVLAFRGATAASPQVLSDAGLLDPYGESLTPNSVTFLNADPSWKGDISAIDGARFVQVRATFLSNAETGDIAELSAMGLAFRR